MNVKVTVIVRVLSLIMVLVNQWLSNKEVSPIPVDESTLMTIAVALITMWKDNPFTDAAKENNKLMKELKTQNKYEKVVIKNDDDK
ncbi:phage holin [Staphylococcus equorum]|uniref:phage holin n=1 Tax=Staphylococcus equorum TaxID=246432 RepID=UPI003CF08E60